MLWDDPRAATTIQKRSTRGDGIRINFLFGFLWGFWGPFFLMPDKGRMVNRLPTGRLVWTFGEVKGTKGKREGSTAGKTAQERCSTSILGGFEGSASKAMVDLMGVLEVVLLKEAG